MKHYVIRIDDDGFAMGGAMWEDNAKDKIDAKEKVNAVLAEDGSVLSPAVDAIAEVPAYIGDPLPFDLVLTPIVSDGGIKYRAKWNGSVWVDGGGQLPVVLPSVSPRQIRQALTIAGLRASVELAVSSGDQNIKDWWEFSTSFERNNAQVVAMGVSLGVADESLNDLWTLAATL